MIVPMHFMGFPFNRTEVEMVLSLVALQLASTVGWMDSFRRARYVFTKASKGWQMAVLHVVDVWGNVFP